MAAREKRAKTPAGEGAPPPEAKPAKGQPKKAPVPKRRGRPSKVAARKGARLDAAKTRAKRKVDPDEGAVPVGAKRRAKTAVAKPPAKRRLVAKKSPPKKMEVKTEPPEEPEPAPAREPTPPPPLENVEVKKEPDLPAPDSRSSSPRGTRKPRTSSDMQLASTVFEAPVGDPLKTLRSGKQRTSKHSLLTEVVEQEGRKRRRLASDAAETKIPVTPKEEEPQPEPVVPAATTTVEPDPIEATEPEPAPAVIEEVAPAPETAPEEPESETTETVETAPTAPRAEKLAEKSLILDNMSKAFNDAAVSDKTKSIRRSARQRKSTAKAKEQEEPDAEVPPPPPAEPATEIEPPPPEPVPTEIVEPPASEEKETATIPEIQPEAPPPPPTAEIEPELSEEPPKDKAATPPFVPKAYTHQDFDKLIDRLKCLEEQDRKRQEEISKLNSRTVMVTEDVVLIPKKIEIVVEKKTEDVIVSIVEKEEARKSFEIDLPSSVTLIKRTSATPRKRSTTKDDDSVTMIDKSLGKEVALDIRKSIDKAALSIEPVEVAVPETAIEPIVETLIPAEIVVVAAATAMAPVIVKDIAPETLENQKEKEKVLNSLGLYSLEAANRAKIDKQRQKELIKSNKSALPKYSSDGYTGTLKTVIKLNRASPDKKRSRSPLKMTFQKSKSRNGKFADVVGDNKADDHYYTIHKDFGGSSGSSTGSSDNHMTSESGTNDPIGDPTTEPAVSKEATANLVIPEKASSFSIHPGRVCQDQCFYCGLKFGLFDTPCHIAQVKSSDRQKKILDNEEKLTVDSCLCDACYRHVDRRANCPSYRKRAGPLAVPATATPSAGDGDTCYAQGCGKPAPHTFRRKWLVKMKKSLSKVIQLELDYPGLHTIPLCENHYQTVSQLMVCGLCKRRLSRNHIHYVNQEYKLINPLMHEQGIPVVFHEKPVVCKLCRYFCTLLLRPPVANQVNKTKFLKCHRRRLLQAHDVDVPEESDTDYSDEHTIAPQLNRDQNGTTKEKKRGKSGKNKKAPESNKLPDENSLGDKVKTSESWKKSHGGDNSIPNSKTARQDGESIMSSNKIAAAGSKKDPLDYADISDSLLDFDMSLDKQSELQCLLQKCNVPSTTILQKHTDSNQKSKNILKVHNATAAVNKSSHSQKKLNRNERRIQKLGQIITHKPDFEETLSSKIPNREEFTIEPMNSAINDERHRDSVGHGLLRNIALNDECTIETIPAKNTKSSDFNSLKNKWVTTESFSKVTSNLFELSKDSKIKRSHSNRTESQFSNPVHRLGTNPSISVRELFPGEEEMNLQCSIEFGNVKGVTPEGWEKCNSTIQYDNYTKKLWQELQKPYGNQSSFLKHLVLLEKYYRNGDLVLSQHANYNALTYSESVQNRLRSFDNIPTNGEIPTTITPNGSLVVSFPHNGTNLSSSLPHTEVELTKKTDVDFRKPSLNITAGKSLLKSNNQNSCTAKFNKTSKGDGERKGGKSSTSAVVEQAAASKPSKLPVCLAQLEKLGNQLTPIQTPIAPRPPTPRPEAGKSPAEVRVPPVPSSMPAQDKVATPKTEAAAKSKASSLPPELIAINLTPLQNKSMENIFKNLQNVKASSTPVSSASLAIAPAALNNISPIPSSSQGKVLKFTPIAPKESKKSKNLNKQWRPTLIPITDESKARNVHDVLHKTADGRRLPSLVKVTSGGKPYHITIEDYNRMCIMRREKLQQEKSAKLTKNQQAAGSPTGDAPIEAAAKPASPTPTDTDKLTVQKTKELSPRPSTPKIDNNNDTVKLALPDVDILKSVSLKNVTIAPIPPMSDAKTVTTNCNTPLSLEASAMNALPLIISQLNSSLSVTAESIPNVGSPSPTPLTSQAIIMPKIPKSLTVIPQTVVSSRAASPAAGPPSVLPLPAVIVVPATAVSPTEP